jgi:hypothetical protein
MDRHSPPGSPTMINSASWGRLRSRLDGPLTRSRMSDSAIRSSDLSYNSKDNEPSKATTIRLVLLGCIFSGCGLLSVAQHQEPRFLLPLLLPLCVLFAPRFFCFRWWIVSWIIFNISLLVFFGVLHQGGVIPSLIYTQQESLSDTYAGQAVDPVHGVDVIYFKTFMPPRFLVAQPRPQQYPVRLHDPGRSDEKLLALFERLREDHCGLSTEMFKTVVVVTPSIVSLPPFVTVGEPVKSFWPHFSSEDPPSSFEEFFDGALLVLPAKLSCAES